jgi:hypothetical protein
LKTASGRVGTIGKILKKAGRPAGFFKKNWPAFFKIGWLFQKFEKSHWSAGRPVTQPWPQAARPAGGSPLKRSFQGVEG